MSKRFRFRLQRLLELRQLEEKLALEGLGDALRGLEHEEQRLESLEGERGRLWEDLSHSLLTGTMDRARLASLHLGLESLETGIARAERNRCDLSEQVEARQEDVRQRRGAKKAMETLEDRALTAFKEESDRAEAHEIEEVATRRHLERRSS